MINIQFINGLFQKYYSNEYLAVKECRNIKFKRRKNIKTIAMHYQSLSIGGVQRVISLLTPMFIEMGYKLVVITEKIQQETDYDLPRGVDIIVIPNKDNCLKSKSYKERAKAINDIVIEKNIDMVCYHEPWNFTLYDFLAYKINDVSFVLYKHTYISACMVGLDPLIYNQRFVFSLLDKVVVLSEVEKVFWEKLGVETEYIYNPIGKYVNGVSAREENTILWIGRLDSYQKQYMDVVPIMKEVVKAIPDAVLKIYGNECENGAVEKLNRAICFAGLEENIKYCGYTTEDMNAIYGNASVHLVTSVYETFPMAIYESRMNGLPLVLYKMSYLEMLKDGKGYLEVDYDDVKGAAKAIVNILKDKVVHYNMSVEARESVKAFSNTEVKKRWEEIICSLECENEDVRKEKREEKDSVEIILDSLLYHYYKGCIRRKNDVNAELVKRVKKALEEINETRERCIVIYPYGAIGKKVKQILNDEFRIQEAFVVDNNNSWLDCNIKTISDLQKINCSEYYFLVCSNSEEYYEEIRNDLLKVAPRENVIDLYP